MWNKVRPASASIIFMAALSAGCQGKSGTAGPNPVASASANPAPPPGVDGDLLNELKRVGKTCESVPGENRFKCPGGEQWKMVSDFLQKRRERSASVRTLAVALSDGEPGVRGLAANVLRGAFGGPWGQETAPQPVEPAAAKALIDAALAQPPAVARQVLPAAVNAAMLAGQAEPLYAELAKTQHVALRASAYPYLMTLGRMSAFPKVQLLAKDAATDAAVAAAEAPLNMHGWTDVEQQAICNWSEELQRDERAPIAVKAGLMLANCSGAWLDRLLDRSAKLATAAKLDLMAQGPLIAMCGGAQKSAVLKATPAQCARSRALLVQVAKSKRADTAARVNALTWVPQIWPDDESARLLKRLEQDAHGEVAGKAGEAFKLLAETATAQTSSSSTQASGATKPAH